MRLGGGAIMCPDVVRVRCVRAEQHSAVRGISMRFHVPLVCTLAMKAKCAKWRMAPVPSAQ